MKLVRGWRNFGRIRIALVMLLMSSNNAMLPSILEVVDDVYSTTDREISGIVDGCLDGNVVGKMSVLIMSVAGVIVSIMSVVVAVAVIVSCDTFVAIN